MFSGYRGFFRGGGVFWDLIGRKELVLFCDGFIRGKVGLWVE